jgi:hypothetical protein
MGAFIARPLSLIANGVPDLYWNPKIFIVLEMLDIHAFTAP